MSTGPSGTLHVVLQGLRLRQARAQALEHVQDVLRPRAALHAAQPVRELLYLSRTIPQGRHTYCHLRVIFIVYIVI